MSGFTCLSDEELTKTLRFIKDGYTRMEKGVLANPESAGMLQVTANIQVAVIEQFERELKKRGYDVTDPIFGRDVLGELIAAKLKEL